MSRVNKQSIIHHHPSSSIITITITITITINNLSTIISHSNQEKHSTEIPKHIIHNN
jgi:hypothetical protein